jgi:hypothetical protein
MLRLQTQTMVRPNRDCIHAILEYVPIRSVIDVSLGLCTKDDIRDVIQYRIGYKRLLSDIVSDPDELLRSMYEHRYILASGRISQYFTPTWKNSLSKWEFIISGTDESAARSVLSLRDMGIEVIGDGETISEPVPQTVYERCCNRHGRRQQSITIRVVQYHLLKYILKFPISVMCCFLTHFGAVHMYGKLSSMEQAVVFQDAAVESLSITNKFNVNCPVHAAYKVLQRVVYNDMDEECTGLVQDRTARLGRFISDSMGDMIFDARSRNVAEEDSMPVFFEYIRSNFKPSDDTTYIEDDILENEEMLENLITVCIDACICITDKAEDDMKVYKDTGYSIIYFPEYKLSTNGWCPPSTRRRSIDSFCRYRSRNLSDPESNIVPFSCPGLKNTSMFISQMKSYSWYEYYAGLLPVGMESLISRYTGVEEKYICTASV